MSTPNNVAELLRKGIEAKNEGKRSEAQDYFQQVVDLDEKNEKGWFWLASVVESDEERIICLGNVLHINPNNERAKRALEALQAKVKDKKTTVAETEAEVIPGVSRRSMTLVVGIGAVLVVVILIIAVVVIAGNNSRIASENAARTEVAQVATNGAETAVALAVEATGTFEAAAATAAALVTPMTPTSSAPTLPPEWTPTPMATVPPTREALPIPTGLTGRLAIWGGQDLLNIGYLPVGYYDFDQGGQFTQIGTSYGANVVFAPSGQRVMYTVYDQLLFNTSLEAINVNGTEVDSLPNRWRGQNILQPQMPSYSPDGQLVVFVARTQTRQTSQVFLLNLNDNSVRQLTDDEATYSYPIMSPDTTKVIALRSNPDSAGQVIDLTSIDLATISKIPVTNDGQSYSEMSPFYTADGLQVVYAAQASNAPGNHDIFIRSTDGTGSSTLVYASPDGSDDIYPVLTRDGRYIAFANNSSGSYDIYVYDRNTQTLSQLTDTPNVDEFPGDWWHP